MAIDFNKPGWLARTLELYLHHYDPAATEQVVEDVRRAFPQETPTELAVELAKMRLRAMRLQPNLSLLPDTLNQHLAREGLSPEDLLVVGMMTTEWDILLDIARLHDRELSQRKRPLALLTVMALGKREYPLARRIHEGLKRVVTSKVELSKHAARLEGKLKRGQLPVSQKALSVGIGLAYLEARALARISAVYCEGDTLADSTVFDAYHDLLQTEKERLVEVLLALAWADGKIVDEERELIQGQVVLGRFDEATSSRLLGYLEQPLAFEDLQLAPLDSSARRFILEQAILLSLIDDDQDPRERDVLQQVCERLGGSGDELEQIMVEVAAFYEANRDLVHAQQSSALQATVGFLQRLFLERATGVIKQNLSAIVTEIRETGELAALMAAASQRKLTPEEIERVKSQLYDILKTIPALGIFLLPGGGLILPIVIKMLPFNILPTAFGSEDALVVDDDDDGTAAASDGTITI